jgi:DNA-binding transcriptional LysR family regulator
MEEPFVLLSEAHCLGEQVMSFCKQSSCLPSVSCHSAQLLTVQEMVGLGQGVSLIPQMAAAADKSEKRQYRSLSGKKPTRTIAMMSRANRHQTRLVREFMQQARTSLRK